MDIELVLLIKKHTDTLIEQTKSKPQETLEFKTNKQMQTFSFSPPHNLLEKNILLLAVTNFEATKVFFIEPTKTIAFQSLYQVIGIPKLLKNLMMN